MYQEWTWTGSGPELDKKFKCQILAMNENLDSILQFIIFVPSLPFFHRDPGIIMFIFLHGKKLAFSCKYLLLQNH